MKNVGAVYGESDDTKSCHAAEGPLARFPEPQGIIGPDAAAAPATARAVQGANKVWVTGSALPTSMRVFVKVGRVKSFFLWSFVDFRYLTHMRSLTRSLRGGPGPRAMSSGSADSACVRLGRTWFLAIRSSSAPPTSTNTSSRGG
jgi:ABC-type sugar transport system substrate-binding protein